ncbi:uncharacterized protein ASPGLDRAFT_125764 [Aspergillus glaucus CBS 516.65]|uniref:SWI5-dependent HO expression protein 3 n=1 Tax=Aspergillus glaucus CBS 516.65 TaxID=1160497 RepID=A0A1L9VLB4_ASPGL|nr:hypothetical protein ASPGLDRAFT_125764 [Aspergillus glaucus CBS 516.65]OJJ84681.1 hypothetical protein ASPGLDRAFT_125764 [Aspergillus glaucus CBS 516.65]
MVRFGRIKKKTKAEPVQDASRLSNAKSSSQEPYQEHDADTDINDPLPFPGPGHLPRKHAPRISLPHVDTTLLNMHQANGLFDSKSSEEQNGATVIESTDQSISLSPNPPLSPNPSNGDAHSANGDASTTEWSSAVGHATTGKSGRVIHALQEDVARLTRECGVHRSKAEEAQNLNDTLKTQVQNIGERLRNLEVANETNLQSISRKDQKMKELRAEAQSEKERRQKAEGTANRTDQLMTEARDDYNRKVAGLQEIANHSKTQYDVLAQSGNRDRSEQQRRFKTIRDDYIALKTEHDKRIGDLERLDTILAEKDHEIEASRERFSKLFETYEAYKKAREEEMGGLIENGYRNEAKIDTALATMKETEGRMKWVIQVSEGLRDSSREGEKQ